MKVIFLDLDNTLTDRTATIVKYAAVFLNDFADRLSAHLTPNVFADTLNQLDKGGYSTHEKRSEELIALDIWHDAPSVIELVEHWQSWVPHHSLPLPGLLACLDALTDAGYRLCLVSNGQGHIQRAKIEALGIASYFEAVVISGEVNIKKPDAGIFQRALSLMQCEPSNAVFVGDHPINDYLGSQQMGMLPIWFQGSHEWPEKQTIPRYSINHLAQLPILLEQIQRHP